MTVQQILAHPAHAALLAMPHPQLQQAAVRLYDAFVAATEEARHIQQALGGWEECPGCQAANDQCDSGLCCAEGKARQARISAAWRLQ